MLGKLYSSIKMLLQRHCAGIKVKKKKTIQLGQTEQIVKSITELNGLERPMDVLQSNRLCHSVRIKSALD